MLGDTAGVLESTVSTLMGEAGVSRSGVSLSGMGRASNRVEDTLMQVFKQGPHLGQSACSLPGGA